MATIPLPGGRKLTGHKSNAPSGSRKAKTLFVGVKGKKGSAKSSKK